MSLFHNNGNGNKKNDEFYTYKKDWEAIQEYIPKDKKVWEPFSNVENLEGPQYLKEITQELVMASGDFFQHESPLGDVVVSNPPFSIKKDILMCKTHLKKVLNRAKLNKDEIEYHMRDCNNMLTNKELCIGIVDYLCGKYGYGSRHGILTIAK